MQYPFLSFDEQTAKRKLLKMFSEQQQPPKALGLRDREALTPSEVSGAARWRRGFAVVLCAVFGASLAGSAVAADPVERSIDRYSTSQLIGS
jgi:hypothetical protein